MNEDFEAWWNTLDKSEFVGELEPLLPVLKGVMYKTWEQATNITRRNSDVNKIPVHG